MGSYLLRYEAGEHQAVWRELSAEGERVWQPLFYEDAAAVARTTMARVETNLVRLHERLLELGFAFADPDGALVPAQPDWEDRLESVEAEFGRICIAGRAWYGRFHNVCFVQSVDQLEGREGPPALHGLGSHPELVMRSLGDGLEAFARYKELTERESQEVGHPIEVEAHLPIGPVLSNCETASFEFAAAAFDEPRFAADGRDALSTPFIGFLREAILEGGGFPFWLHMAGSGIDTPSWIRQPDWEGVRAQLTRDLVAF